MSNTNTNKSGGKLSEEQATSHPQPESESEAKKKSKGASCGKNGSTGGIRSRKHAPPPPTAEGQDDGNDMPPETGQEIPIVATSDTEHGTGTSAGGTSDSAELELVTDYEPQLTRESKDELLEIEKGLKKALFEFAEGLYRINEKGLYKHYYPTFTEYAKKRLGISKSRAYELRDFYVIARAIQDKSAMADTVLEIPTNERQTRPLSGLDADDQINVWTEALQKAKKAKKALPTGAQVKAAMKELGISSKNARTGKKLKGVDSFVKNLNQLFERFGKIQGEELLTYITAVESALAPHQARAGHTKSGDGE